MKKPYLGWTAEFACITLFIMMLARCTQAANEKKEHAVAKNEKDGAEIILIPGGHFLMGSTKAEVDAQFLDTGLPEDWKKYTQDEEPRHRRSVDPLYIYKYEVTNEQYKKFCDATGQKAP